MFINKLISTTSSILFTMSILTTTAVKADTVKPLIEADESQPRTWLDEALSSIGAEEGFDRTKGLDVGYIPSVFYNPEMKFGGGLLAIGLYKTDSASEEEEPSSVVFNSYISTNLSLGVTVDNMTFFNEGKDRLPVYFELHDEPKIYYGKGFESGDNDNNKIRYREVMFTVTPKWMTEIKENLFVGLGAEFTFVNPRHEEVDEELIIGNPVLINDLEANSTVGITASALFDSRDYLINPTKGWLMQVDAGAYYNELENNPYGKFNLEVLNFTTIDPLPGLLAFQAQAHLSSGDVPWNKLSDIGGAYAMRGYILGRYRDDQMAMAQVEYRLPVYRRSGAVLWAGVGSIGDSLSDLADDTLASYGIGYRFLIKGRMNIRADLGFGKNETGFYFNVNEVF